MSAQNRRLEIVEITNPCSADWDAMRIVAGNRVRFCRHCGKHVFNLSEMPRDAAEQLITEQIGGDELPCVRMYRRVDGTVVTHDCRDKWTSSVSNRAKRWGGWIAATCTVLLAFVGCEEAPSQSTTVTSPTLVLQGMLSTGHPSTEPSTQPGNQVMVKICPVSPDDQAFPGR